MRRRASSRPSSVFQRKRFPNFTKSFDMTCVPRSVAMTSRYVSAGHNLGVGQLCVFEFGAKSRECVGKRRGCVALDPLCLLADKSARGNQPPRVGQKPAVIRGRDEERWPFKIPERREGGTIMCYRHCCRRTHLVGRADPAPK